MSSSSQSSSASDESPFLVQVFYRTGSLHRPDEFSGNLPASNISIYAWGSSSLDDLALDLADAKPSALPFPSLGTRLVFQLVYPETNESLSQMSGPNFIAKDLGSIVIGEGCLIGLGDRDLAQESNLDTSGAKTLDDARFMIGDYISCAILPPLSDGSVAPTENAHRRDHMDASRHDRPTRGGRSQGETRGSFQSMEWSGRGHRSTGRGYRTRGGGRYSNFSGSRSHGPGGSNQW